MGDLALVGLGAMGSALGRAFVAAGHKLVVWNRSAEKMAPLVDAGATGATTLSEAIASSPVVVICIDNYTVTREMLDSNVPGSELAGRVVIQLSTGTPDEARSAESWFSDRDADYIDGAIMPYPEEIGRDDAQLLFAGKEKTFSSCRPLLECLGGDLRYLGANIGSAAAMDMALLTRDLSLYLGVAHGLCLCEAEGIPAETYSGMYPHDHPAKSLIETIRKGSFDDAGATIDVWLAAIGKIQAETRNLGINAEVPNFIASFFDRASSMGYGSEDTAAIIKVMRAAGRN